MVGKSFHDGTENGDLSVNHCECSRLSHLDKSEIFISVERHHMLCQGKLYQLRIRARIIR